MPYARRCRTASLLMVPCNRAMHLLACTMPLTAGVTFKVPFGVLQNSVSLALTCFFTCAEDPNAKDFGETALVPESRIGEVSMSQGSFSFSSRAEP